MTIGELMNTLIQAVDCDGIDTDTQITFHIPTIAEYIDNFKSAKIEVKKNRHKALHFRIKIIKKAGGANIVRNPAFFYIFNPCTIQSVQRKRQIKQALSFQVCYPVYSMMVTREDII